MPRAILFCFVLLSIACQDPPEPAKPALPESPVFREPGAQVVLGEQLFRTTKGHNLWIDFNPKGRRVILRGSVCLRRGQLEEFLCKKGTKEHESIVVADAQPRLIHAALIAAGAESGHVAQFEPKFQPPTGDRIEVSVEWSEGGRTKRVKAQQWIRDLRTGKALEHDWVFAGSQEVDNPITKERYYLANDGDVISVSNFASSLLDLSIESSNSDAEHLFEALEERIPPEGTEVFVILRPMPSKKNKSPAPVAPAQPGAKPADEKSR